MAELFLLFFCPTFMISGATTQLNFLPYQANPNRPDIFGGNFQWLSDSLPSFRNEPKEEASAKKISLKEELYEQKSFLGRVSTAITIVDFVDGRRNRTEKDNDTKLNSANKLSASKTTTESIEEEETEPDQEPDEQEETAATVRQRQETVNTTAEAVTECVGFEFLQGAAEFGKGILKFVALASDSGEE